MLAEEGFFRVSHELARRLSRNALKLHGFPPSKTHNPYGTAWAPEAIRSLVPWVFLPAS